MAARRAAQR